MFSYLNITTKGLVLILVPLVFELIFVAILAQELTRAANQFDRLKASQKMMLELHSTLDKAFRISITFGNLEAPPEERLKAAREIRQLASRPGYFGDVDLNTALTSPEELAEFEDTRRYVASIARKLESTVTGTSLKALPRAERDELIINVVQFRSMVDRVKAEAKRLDSYEPDELNRLFTRLVSLMACGFVISCGISFLLAYLLTFDIARRLGIIGDNAVLLAAGEELPAPKAGEDEIAALDAQLNRTSRQLRDFRNKELTVLNNSADVVCSVDKQLRFLAIGESAERIWGYALEDLIGRSLLTILANGTIEDASKKFDQSLLPGEHVELETVIKCKNGTLKDALWIINWSSEAEEFVCVVHDITESKKVERLKQVFISMVSHDLRTPLASMNVNVTNINSGVCGPIPKGAEKILSNTELSMSRLTGLVNDLLDLDKLESGKLTLNLECISLRDVCQSSIAALESMAAGAGIELAAPQGDAAVMADEKRLVQAVTNLISNAIKFSPPGTRIRTEIVESDVVKHPQQVEVRVIDQGPGMSTEVQALLFDKYKLSTAATSVAIKSTGLGLAIVKSIVKAHKGEVGVSSRIDKGSTFFIRLPEFTDEEEPA